MCEERERLIGYVYDECDAGERRAIEAHLDGCPTCRHEIRGLRGVRQDLLAWHVPDHEPIWRPLAPPRTEASWISWNTMPTWAMAAAAALLLMVGGAGGAATYALLPSAAPAQSARVAAPANAPVASTRDQAALIAMLEERLDRLEQANAAGATVRAAGLQSVVPAADMQRVNATVNRLAARVDGLSDQQTRMAGVLFDMTQETISLRGGLRSVQRDNDNFAKVSFTQNPSGGR